MKNPARALFLKFGAVRTCATEGGRTWRQEEDHMEAPASAKQGHIK
jgi:hypothetical protein